MFGKKSGGKKAESGWGSAESSQGEAFWGEPVSSGAPVEPQPQASVDTSFPAHQAMPRGARNLLELVDPLFLFVCRMHRLDKEGGGLVFSKVRSDVERLLNEIEKTSRQDAALQTQYTKVKDSILWSVDFWFSSPGRFTSIRSEWNRNRMGKQSDDDGILTGDDAFFDELDKTLSLDTSDKEANERLAFYYTAIGLGFTGRYFKDIPEHKEKLRDYMDRMFPRVRNYVELTEGGKLTPESYNYTDTRDFVAPARDRPIILWLAGLFLFASIMVGYLWFYGHYKQELEQQVKSVLDTKTIRN